MKSVELLAFPSCPNLPAARAQLQKALTTAGISTPWVEHDVSASDAPAHVRGFGSPTILVDGEDVTGAAAGEATSCRVYPGSDAPGAPPLQAILAALTR